MRRYIAWEAARILAEQEYLGFAKARHKAAVKLGNRDRRQLPDYREIELALREYQKLFLRDIQPAALRRLRKLALEAMHSLRAFEPQLVGAVLHGTAGARTPVRLHLYAETPEEVALALMEKRIPWEEREVLLEYPRGLRKAHPLFRFQAGDATVELVVLEHRERSNPPLDELGLRPCRGAGRPQVAALLQAD